MRLLSQFVRLQGQAGKLVENLANFSTCKEIARSGFFDANWYLLSHPYLFRDGVEPLAHFIKNGRRHVLSPSRKFDTAYYLDHHSDAVGADENPLLHYLRKGQQKGLSIREAPPSVADRINSSGLFDDQWYLDTYPEVRESGQPPLLHYLVQGYREGKSPGPDFDAKWYLAGYPDVSNIDPLLHYIDHGRDEGRAPVRPMRIQKLAKETVESVEDLEPELCLADYLAHVDDIPIVSGPAGNPLSRSFKEIIKAVPAPPRAIVFVPWFIRGSEGLVTSHAVEALATEHGPKSVVVITTDDDRLEATHLIPAGVAVISLTRSDQRLSEDRRKDLVDLIVRGLQPDVVLNVNSRACWEAFKYFGRRLSSFSRLYAMSFSPDYAEHGRRIGYAHRYMPHCLPHLSGVYSDNRTHIGDLIAQLGLPDELQRLLVPLYQPAPRWTLPGPVARKPGRLQVLWAGPLGQDKNVQLLADIARDAPQFDFHLWGRGEKDLEEVMDDLQKRCDNLRSHGLYESFDELPLSEYDVFLYTSLWDGLPIVLLDAAAAGLPIVSSDVGGIGELVDQKTSWLVSSLTDTAPYIDALNTIAGDQEQVDARKKEMARRLEDRHGWDRYRETLATEPRETFGLLMPKSLPGLMRDANGSTYPKHR